MFVNWIVMINSYTLKKDQTMKNFFTCFLLAISFIVLTGCGKKEAPKPEETQKTEVYDRQSQSPSAGSAQLSKEAAPAPEMAEYAEEAPVAGSPAPAEPRKDAASPRETSFPGLANSLRADTSAPKDKKFIRTGEIKFRVNNVHKSTEMVEDLTAKYSGFVTFSNLTNLEERSAEHEYTKDTIVVTKSISVQSEIVIRVPAEKLDSLVRELNQILVFLDYRKLMREDVTFKFLTNQMQKKRMNVYEQRQTKNIDTKRSTLESKTYAEESLLAKQMQADDLELQNLSLEDQVKYCTITLYLYQPPTVISEKRYNFEYIEELRPSFWETSWNSIVRGWWGLEDVITAVITIWPIILLLIAGFIVWRRVSKKTQNK